MKEQTLGSFRLFGLENSLLDFKITYVRIFAGTHLRIYLLQNAVTCIQKAQVEEKRIYTDNTDVSEETPTEGRVPPPPILLSRTDNSVVFKPAPWRPSTEEKVTIDMYI